VNEERFDHLARELATGSVSRRQALRFVGAALATAVLTPLLPEKAEALTRRLRRLRRRCRRQGGTVCHRKCVDTMTDTQNRGECGHVCEDDGNPCTEAVCASGFCGNNFLPVGVERPGGVCDGLGACVPT
jgi:Stigma-specific protein, Stig1